MYPVGATRGSLFAVGGVPGAGDVGVGVAVSGTAVLGVALNPGDTVAAGGGACRSWYHEAIATMSSAATAIAAIRTNRIPTRPIDRPYHQHLKSALLPHPPRRASLTRTVR